MKFVKKRDIFIIAVILLIVVIIIAITKISNNTDAVVANIYYIDKIIKVVSLSEDKTYDIFLDEAQNMIITVDKDTIMVKKSDCPDKVCVHTGKISKYGEMAVCLPKKILIKIENLL